MADVPYVTKQSSQGLSYTFASEREFLEKMRPALLRHGVDVTPVSAQLISAETVTTNKGGTMQLTRILSTYRFTHGDSGTHQDVMVFGEAFDSGDKSLPKSMTIAQKYALRQWALVETGDDPDVIAHHRESPRSAMFARCARTIYDADQQRLMAVRASLCENKSKFAADELASLTKLADDQEAFIRSQKVWKDGPKPTPQPAQAQATKAVPPARPQPRRTAQ